MSDIYFKTIIFHLYLTLNLNNFHMYQITKYS